MKPSLWIGILLAAVAAVSLRAGEAPLPWPPDFEARLRTASEVSLFTLENPSKPDGEHRSTQVIEPSQHKTLTALLLDPGSFEKTQTLDMQDRISVGIDFGSGTEKKTLWCGRRLLFVREGDKIVATALLTEKASATFVRWCDLQWDAAQDIPLPPAIVALLANRPEMILIPPDAKNPVDLTPAQKEELRTLLLTRGNWYHGLYSVLEGRVPWRLLLRSGTSMIELELKGSLVIVAQPDGRGSSAMWNQLGEERLQTWLGSLAKAAPKNGFVEFPK